MEDIYFEDKKGPITKLLWGRIFVDNKEHSKEKGVGKDIRIIYNEVSAWKERQGHDMGAERITGVFDADILVIGIGILGDLNILDNVKKKIKDKSIELIILKTPAACKKYNELFRQGKNVAFLAHTTC